MSSHLPVSRRDEWVLTMPMILWLLVFFLVPTAVMLGISFREATPTGALGDGWSLRGWKALGNPDYLVIVWRTFRLSFWTTLVCLSLSLPVSFLLGKMSKRWRGIVLMLVIVPFWTNFVIRVAAWKVMLHPEGFLRQGLLKFGLIGDDTLLMYNEGAVLLVMIYTYLPFAILPLYAASERFDYQLLDAARDLGAGKMRSFFSVFIPGVKRGLLTAVALVFIPAMGSYLIPDLVGGPTGEMLGNKIAQRTLGDRNLPEAAALAIALLVITLIPLVLALRISRRRQSIPADASAR